MSHIWNTGTGINFLRGDRWLYNYTDKVLINVVVTKIAGLNLTNDGFSEVNTHFKYNGET
jgi:hypothetical protein